MFPYGIAGDAPPGSEPHRGLFGKQRIYPALDLNTDGLRHGAPGRCRGMEDRNPREKRCEPGMSTGVIALLGFAFIALLISTGNDGQALFSRAPDRMAQVARLSPGDTLAGSTASREDPSSTGLKDELTYRDYLVRITNRRHEGSLQIFREGSEIFARSAAAAFSVVGVSTGGKHLLLMGTDVTGNSQPDLVILERSMDALDSATLHLFEIGD